MSHTQSKHSVSSCETHRTDLRAPSSPLGMKKQVPRESSGAVLSTQSAGSTKQQGLLGTRFEPQTRSLVIAGGPRQSLATGPNGHLTRCWGSQQMK